MQRLLPDAVYEMQPQSGACLAGVGEIRTVQRLLQESGVPSKHRCTVLPLHGNLSPEAQDEAIRPGRGAGRRVILATPIAESSVTIDGVRVVVDSGLRRVRGGAGCRWLEIPHLGMRWRCFCAFHGRCPN